jgi:hypothetical protein
MIIALIFGLLLGNTVQLQNKYDYCKSKNFKGEYCEVQKKLHEANK